MPLWLINFFGEKHFDLAFFYLLIMTAPVWLAMLIWPRNDLVQLLASPFLAPILYLPALFYLIWIAREQAILPAMIEYADYRSARRFVQHPISFLALFCKIQILHLAIGTLIFQKARQLKMEARIEILLAWFLGVLALLPFSLRLLFRQKSLKL